MVKQIKVTVPSGTANWGQALQQRENHHRVQASCLQGPEGIDSRHVRENSTLISEIRDRRKYYLKGKVELDESFTGRNLFRIEAETETGENKNAYGCLTLHILIAAIAWDFFYKTLSQALPMMGHSQRNSWKPWIPPAGGSEESPTSNTDCPGQSFGHSTRFGVSRSQTCSWMAVTKSACPTAVGPCFPEHGCCFGLKYKCIVLHLRCNTRNLWCLPQAEL